jgi:hypothetical protein
MVGDFGTGDWGSESNLAASTKIRRAVEKLRPQISIHLGDVYYAGTAGAELANLVDIWPAGTIGSLALNSNHEMYPGGWHYYDEALGSAKFRMQNQCSFFALENDNWIIVGIDSAYGADPYGLYNDGALDQQGLQATFLKTCAAR